MTSTMTLDDISRQLGKGDSFNIEVHAVELALYVPYLIADNQRHPLTDKSGHSLRYPSRYAALRALKQTGLATVDVIHVSPYDEMIGVQSSPGQSEMRERVALAHIGDV